jgi:cysteinyl-tRNA synthetase
MSYIQQYENLKQMLGIRSVSTGPNAALNTEEDIYLYNTLSRSKEKFVPIDEKNVRIYSCGPTVYHYAHIGNLRAYVFANILQAVLKTKYNHITHVINITDVGHNTDDGDNGEDKMEKGSKRENKSAEELAQFYTDAFYADLKSLHINLDNFKFPKATDYINEQIKIVENLVDKGYVYKIEDDGMYFDTSKFEDYAKLGKLKLNELKKGARVEFADLKRNTSDFAVWKFSPKNKQRQMEWESPWGVGFPGWHIECSAMSREFLGNHFDIHTGGVDHIPVHHTNEIAQSECSTGEKYVNYWMHVNFLNDKSGKMSKSNDDFLRLRSIIDTKIDPIAFKYYLYTTHYRSEIAFSFESLEGAAEAYKKLYNFVAKNKNPLIASVNASYYKRALKYLYDDISTPQVIATIWEMIGDKNINDADKAATILQIDKILGLNLENAEIKEIKISDELQKLLDERKIAKQNKNWQEADKIRKDIENLGYLIKDSGQDQELIEK